MLLRKFNFPEFYAEERVIKEEGKPDGVLWCVTELAIVELGGDREGKPMQLRNWNGEMHTYPYGYVIFKRYSKALEVEVIQTRDSSGRGC